MPHHTPTADDPPAVLPTWATDGPRTDPRDTPDALDILEGDEWDAAWHLVDVPADAYRAILPSAYRGGATLPMHGVTTVAAEQARFDDLLALLTRDGTGPDALRAALRAHPGLLRIDPETGSLDLLDGWHRAVLAVHHFGLAAIPTLVAVCAADA